MGCERRAGCIVSFTLHMSKLSSKFYYGYPRAPVTNKVFNFRCHWKHATHLGKFSRFLDMFHNFLETNLRKIAARRRDG